MIPKRTVTWSFALILLVLVLQWTGLAAAMPPDRIVQLRQETVDMFYHGFDNYMQIAFPEDEVRWSYERFAWFSPPLFLEPFPPPSFLLFALDPIMTPPTLLKDRGR